MTLIEIFTIIIVHYIADFIFQTDEMAINKSKSNLYLFRHVFIYTLVWLTGTILFCIPQMNNFTTELWSIYVLKFVIIFPLITFICHFITDYYTSRWSSYLYQKGERHNFFLVIGFDQILHYLQLFITYNLLKWHLI